MDRKGRLLLYRATCPENSGSVRSDIGPRREVGWALAVLSWAGYEIERAGTPDEAARILRARRFDAVIFPLPPDDEETRISLEILTDPDLRRPWLVLLPDRPPLAPPLSSRFVPTAYLKHDFDEKELLDLVEKLCRIS